MDQHRLASIQADIDRLLAPLPKTVGLMLGHGEATQRPLDTPIAHHPKPRSAHPVSTHSNASGGEEVQSNVNAPSGRQSRAVGPIDRHVLPT